jgi:O-antigen/teichoic acid export membrane protein
VPRVVTDTVAPPATAGPDRAGIGGAARGGVLNLLGAAFSSVAGFAVTVLTVRGLGQVKAGVLFSATAVFLIASMVAKLGTPTALVYWLSRLRVLQRRDLLRRALGVALGPVGLAGVLTGAALFVWAEPAAQIAVSSRANASPAQLDDFVTQLRIMAVLVPLAALSDAVLAATRGYRNMRATVLVEKILRPGIQIVALGIAVMVGSRVTSVYTLGSTAPYLVTVVLAWLWLRRLIRRQNAAGRTAPPPAAELSTLKALDDKHFARDFWRFTTPRAVASVIQLVLQRSGILLVSGMLGFASGALFTSATRFVIVGQLGNQAISTAVQPRLAEALTRGDRATANALYQTSTGWLVLTAWPIYVMSAVFAPVYLRLFGDDFTTSAAIAIVWLMAIATMFANGCGMVDMVLAMAGKTSWNLINVTIALIINVVLTIVLIPPLGLAGAAVAWAAALIVSNAIPVVQIARSLKLKPYSRGGLLVGALSIVAYGLVGGAFRLAFADTWTGELIAMFATAIVGSAIYLAGVWRLREPLHLAAFRNMRRGKESRS